MPRTADRTLTAKEKRFYFYLTTWKEDEINILFTLNRCCRLYMTCQETRGGRDKDRQIERLANCIESELYYSWIKHNGCCYRMYN